MITQEVESNVCIRVIAVHCPLIIIVNIAYTPPYVCIFNLTQALHVNPYIAKAVKYVIQCFLLIDKIVALCHSQICLVIVSWGTNRIFPCAKHFAKMLGSMSLMQYFSVLWL